MPTYEYACTECGDQLEVVQSFSDDALTVCPACKGKLRKVFSPVGVVFKGSGFYKTDSRAAKSNGAKPADAAKSSESSSDSSSTSSDSSGSSGSGDLAGKGASDSKSGSGESGAAKSGSSNGASSSSKRSDRSERSERSKPKGGGSKVA